MPLKKLSDIATFYTELAEVSLTNSLLLISLLDEQPSEEELERHRRMLSERLPKHGFNLVLDLRYAQFRLPLVVSTLLPENTDVDKIAVVINSQDKITCDENVVVFNELDDALSWSRITTC